MIRSSVDTRHWPDGRRWHPPVVGGHSIGEPVPLGNNGIALPGDNYDNGFGSTVRLVDGVATEHRVSVNHSSNP